MDNVPEYVSALWRELGPATPQVISLGFVRAGHGEPPSWALELDGGVSLLVYWHAEPARLVLIAPLGTVRPAQALQVYESLLCFNTLHHETGGVCAALGGPGGEILLSWPVAAGGLSLDSLQQAVLGFASLAQAWSAYVADPSPDTLARPGLIPYLQTQG